MIRAFFLHQGETFAMKTIKIHQTFLIMFFHARNRGSCQRDGEETEGRIFLCVNEEVGLEICKWETAFFFLSCDWTEVTGM